MIKKAANGISHYMCIKILKKFSRKEINGFDKFISSPFYNNHSTIIRLFRELKKFYPSFEDPELTRQYLFSKINENKKYNDKLFRKYFSIMNKLAEEYLVVIQMRSESFRQEISLLHQLSRRNISDVYLRKIKVIEKETLRSSSINTERYLLNHQLFINKFNFQGSQYQVKHNSELLINSYDNLLNFFLYEASSILNQIKSNMYSFNITDTQFYNKCIINSDMIELLISEILKNNEVHDKNRKIFLNLILNDLRLNDPEKGKSAYENLKMLVNKNAGIICRELLFYYLQRLNVFCIIEKAKGNSEMNRDLLENYKLILEKDLFNFDDSPGMKLLDFISIINCAVKCEEYEWLEKFVRNFNKFVSEELSINLVSYGMAVLSFCKNEYEESLNYINKIEESSLPVTINIYVLKAKIFYMLGYKDSALSLADSFRHFISGNRHISDFHKKTLTNFLKYYKIILNLKSADRKVNIKVLIIELENQKDIREKKWILERCLEFPDSV